MAKKRRHHRNGPRRTRRSRRASRSILRNSPSIMQDLGMALVAGGVSYLATNVAGAKVGELLPAKVPQRELVGNLIVAAGAIALAEVALKNHPKARIAAQATALVPLVNAGVNMAGLGANLGTQHILMLPAPAPGSSPAPGMAAALEARLEARLEDEYQAEY